MKKGVGLLLVLAVLFFANCEKSEEKELDSDLFNTQVEKVTEVEILYSDSAQVRVRIRGAIMLNHLDRRNLHQEFTEGIVVHFFDENQQINSQLAANYAVRYEKEGKVICRDSVVWTSISGEKLETEELIWEEKEEEIYTRKFARITTPTEIIYGHGFRAKQDFSNARIQQIEGIIAVDDLE